MFNAALPCRSWVLLALLVLSAQASMPVFATDATSDTHGVAVKGASAPAKPSASGAAVAPLPVALPEDLTRESVRDLMSRLSDQQVRGLLIEQLDRAVVADDKAAPSKGARPSMTDMSGMTGMVNANAGMLRQNAGTLAAAFLALPSTLRDVAAQLGRDEHGVRADEYWLHLTYLAIMLLIGWIAQRLYRHVLRQFRVELTDSAATGFFARAFQLGMGLLLDLGAIAVFALAAFITFLTFRDEHDLWRITTLAILFSIVVVWVAVLLARFLLGAAGGKGRLLPFADRPARQLRAFVIALAVLFGLGAIMSTALTGAKALPATMDAVRIIMWLVGLVIAIGTVWRVRIPIASLIRGGAGHGAVRGWLADLWPFVATGYFLVLFASSLSSMLAQVHEPFGVGFASVLLVIALPLVDMVLCRALDAAFAVRKPESGEAATRIPAEFANIFRRAIHVVVILGGMLIFAQLWDLSLFRLAEERLGGKIASSLLGIAIVLLATYLVWSLSMTSINRRLAAEGERKEDVPMTRLRTVLPILRVTLMVTIVMISAMSILAALGVDILPLLAGASIVGVAIGFGSQTLVRDVVSGAFFLMDDAFRLGEYIDVGGAKGRVEKINVRSVFLRHHRGALNVVPYGQIHRLSNTSRDWAVHVMEFRLTYDTNLALVKKIMKKIGEDLAANPEYAADIIQPLKSGGVMAAEDSAMVVRAKFTARPGSTAWMVRKTAYQQIISEFRKAGIRFANRQVTVNASNAEEAAAAAAIASDASDAGGGDANQRNPQHA